MQYAIIIILFIDTLLSVLYCLWEEEKREMQSFGCDLAQENRVILRGETEEEVKEAISCIKHLLTNKSWWDTVDALSYQGESQKRSRDRHITFRIQL